MTHRASGCALYVAEAGPGLAGEWTRGAVEQELGVAQNGVERRPQVVAQARPARRLQDAIPAHIDAADQVGAVTTRAMAILRRAGGRAASRAGVERTHGGALAGLRHGRAKIAP